MDWNLNRSKWNRIDIVQEERDVFSCEIVYQLDLNHVNQINTQPIESEMLALSRISQIEHTQKMQSP